ncbi:hypothetical protein [Roseomonas harenae]|uniref:hypothetical protein n=1 Tax=Muricoccus harenae TaxID=2692566 RepID=UPI0013315B60|nr:hypothetical protein [Roseomonas harenae]
MTTQNNGTGIHAVLPADLLTLIQTPAARGLNPQQRDDAMLAALVLLGQSPVEPAEIVARCAA